MKIKQYFEKNFISIRRWALANNLDLRTTYYVINGELTGERNTKGNTRKVFEALYNDGIIKELPSAFKESKAS